MGLATVTCLSSGAMHRRDSLGTSAEIAEGAVDWMIAGNGITPSERTSAEVRTKPSDPYGIRTWAALPEAHEDDAPAFEHAAKERLPFLEGEGGRFRLPPEETEFIPLPRR